MFQVGQKVVCVDASAPKHCTRHHMPNGLVLHAVYTIRVYDEECGVCLQEVLNPVRVFSDGTGEGHWDVSRFRPITERKTDISFAHEILRKVTKRKTVKEPFPSKAWNG